MYAEHRESRIQDDTLILNGMEKRTEKTEQNKHLLVVYRDLRLQCITALQNLNDQITMWWEECEKHPNLIQELNNQSLEIQKIKEAVHVDKTLLSQYDHKAKTLLRDYIELMHKWRPEMDNKEPYFFKFSYHSDGLMTGNFDGCSKEGKDKIGAMCTILPQEYEDKLAYYKGHIAQLHDMKNKIRRETLAQRKKLHELFTAEVSRVGAADSTFCNLSQQLVSTYKNVYGKKMDWLEEEESLLQTVNRLYSISQSEAVEEAENTKLKNSQRDQEQNAKYCNELEVMLESYKKKCQAIERTSQTTRRETDRQQSTLQEDIEKLTFVVKQLSKRLKELDVKRQEQVKRFHHNMNSLYKRLKVVEQSVHNNFTERSKEHDLLDKEISAAAEIMLKNGQLLQMELEDLIQDVLRMQSNVDKAKI
ncbi:coiled-coil domain-containing protein 175-like [Schistocerca gregaria]|uniref:coiled-coil domain-containing protein 175-like n=1 Tax=Schistocerca gregaria TaxID=7010 RepID=UPI00211E509D|nr:coiled-coil domain-containing protein 175-like [Schistocerca gregaria]